MFEDDVRSVLGCRLLTYDLNTHRKVVWLTRRERVNKPLVVNLVLTNMLACVRKGYKLVYSRDTGCPPMGKRKITARQVIKAVDKLDKLGYINNYVGKASRSKKYREISYITPTPKLLHTLAYELHLIEEEYIEVEKDYLNKLEVSELRDSDEWVEDYYNYEVESKEKMEAVVASLNEINDKHKIVDGDGVVLENSYCRIFNRNYTLGGRWYRADVLQIKHKDTKARLDITIDGDPVVEVDFRGMHFQIAGALEGIVEDRNIPSDVYSYMLQDDVYSEVDYEVLKTAVNIMFNCNSQQASFSAINSYIRELPEEKKNNLILTRAKFIANIVEEYFPEIYSHMNGGIFDFGMALQNADSKLAELIIKHFVENNTPILPVHDSFLVKMKDMDMLLDRMGYCFRRLFDVDYLIPVKIAYKAEGRIFTEEAFV